MFVQVTEVLTRFFLGVGMCLHVGFLPGILTVLAVSAAFAALGMRFFPKAGEMRRSLKLLLLLPGFWIFLGFWGAAFFYDWDSGKPHNPEWMIWVVGAAVALFGLTWIFLLFKLKGARIVTLLFGIWNLYFVLMMGLIAVMSLSGGWI